MSRIHTVHPPTSVRGAPLTHRRAVELMLLLAALVARRGCRGTRLSLRRTRRRGSSSDGPRGHTHGARG
jgi:hypothetical protein